jgi:nicotinamide mononucleotide adenylyltransferase
MNFVIKNSQDKQTLFNYLKELDRDYIVKVKKQRNNRSNMQNNYYWAYIVQPLANELGYFPDELHDALKIKFSSEWQSIEINEKQIGLQTVNSTARMNTKDFEVYADQIRIWALTELGVRLMLPNEFK